MLPLESNSTVLVKPSRMRHSLLLLCALYTPTGGVVLWPVTGKGNVTQALNSIDRGSWNKSAPFSNDTGSGILAVSSPALNATGQSLLNNSKSSLEEALWPPLETYNNVSSLISIEGWHPNKLPLTLQLIVSGPMSTLG